MSTNWFTVGFMSGFSVCLSLVAFLFALWNYWCNRQERRHNAVSGRINFEPLSTEGDEGMPGAIGVIKSVGGTVTGTPSFTDAGGNVVPASGLNPQWASADTTKVTVGPADPTTGASVITGVAPTGSNPDGTPATVAVTCTGTNPDGTADVLTGAVQVADDATGGSISFA